MSLKHVININLKGQNARPDKIGMGELGDFLKHLEAALRAAIPVVDRVSHADEPDPVVSLVSLNEGNSIDMGAAVLDFGIPALSNLTEAISHHSYHSIDIKCHEELNYVSKWVIRHRVQMEIEANESLGIKQVVISKRNPILSPSSPDFTVDGQTTAWGYLTQAGGVKPKAALVFPDKSKVIISADEPTTKELGERLYEDVGIEGVATWRVRDWKMVSFKAIKVLDYRPQKTDIAQSFKDLGEASEGRWNGIDTEVYVRELRDEKE